MASPLFGQKDWDAGFTTHTYELYLSEDISEMDAEGYFGEHPDCTKIETKSVYYLRENF